MLASYDTAAEAERLVQCRGEGLCVGNKEPVGDIKGEIKENAIFIYFTRRESESRSGVCVQRSGRRSSRLFKVGTTASTPRDSVAMAFRSSCNWWSSGERRREKLLVFFFPPLHPTFCRKGKLLQWNKER